MRFRNATSILLAVVGAVLVHSSTASAAVRYVDKDATVSLNDGSSWCDAFLTLQDALAVAVATDEIRVANGTYYPDEGGSEVNGDREASFLLINGVTINGGYAGCGAGNPDGRNTTVFETILSGDIAQNDTPHACTVDSPDCDSNGGRCLDGFCIIDDNNTENSYQVANGSGTDSSAKLDGFMITAGHADGSNPNDRGAGMYNDTGSPTLANCAFRGNQAVWGGGLANLGGNPKVSICAFAGNAASTGGGAMLNTGNSMITNCTFSGNNSGAGGGGGLSNSGSATVTNCTFSGNSTDANGGGIASDGTTTTMTNCTFSGNSAILSGGGLSVDIAIVFAIRNCIFWDNTDSGGTDESAQIHVFGGTPTVIYSIVQGGWTGAGGTGNGSGNPLFVDANGPDNVAGSDDDDLRIRIGSPAVDTGSNTAVPADAADLDGDANTAEDTPFDLDGENRFVDDPDAPNSGEGTPPIVDMGAYELDPPLFVDAGAAGLADGTSWTDAYTKLQDALADALITGGGADEIWVAAGTYYPDEGGGTAPNDRTETFQLVNGVTIYGGFAGTESHLGDRDVDVNVTILSGDLTQNDSSTACVVDSPDCNSNGGRCLDSGFCIRRNNVAENTYHVVTSSGVASAGIDGFTITGGNADGTFPQSHGAGLFVDDSSPVVANCTFLTNSADGAGAIFNVGTGSLSLTDCTFTGNLATGTDGGGAIVTDADIVIADCTFSENHTEWDGGALWILDPAAASIAETLFSDNSSTFAGGAIQVSASGTTISDCIFRDNLAGSEGGAIRIVDSVSNTTIRECTFSDNMAGDTGGAILEFEITGTKIVNSGFFGNSLTNNAGDGGALGIIDSNPQVVNCVFSGNSTGPPTGGTGGGAVFAFGTSAPTFSNCSFTGNISTGGSGGGLFVTSTTVATLDNCVVWGNTPTQLTQFAFGTFDVNYSIVQGGWPGTAVLNANPLFFDANGTDNIVGTEDDDLRLKPGSPARDAGDSTAVPADALDVDNDFNTAERTPLDLDGNPRFVDDKGTVDTGVAASPVVDMGAYEGPSAILFVDVDATGADDGSTWTDAYPNLQDALADPAVAAGTVTQIWVAEGTYKPDIGAAQTPGLRTETFQLVDGVALYGGFNGTETLLIQRNVDLYETILSGDLTGNDSYVACTQDAPDCDSNGALCGDDGFCIIASNNAENAYHVVTGSNTDETAVLDGFTVTSGRANGTTPDDQGAGMYNFDGGPTVAQCTFVANSATTVAGGMLNRNESPNVTDCVFRGNLSAIAGGMNNWTTSAQITNCTFYQNRAGSTAGAMVNQSGSSTITNCSFIGNKANNDGGAMVINVNSNATVVNCLFSGNTAGLDGGGIYYSSGNPIIDNCTFSRNTSADEGGGMRLQADTITVTNNIFWQNSDAGGTDESAQIHSGVGTPAINYCLVQGLTGGLGGTGNIDADPLFLDADGPDNVVGTMDDNLRISACSPAIDAGDNDALPLDTLDLDGDLNTTEPIPYDHLGRGRFKDDPNSADCAQAPGTCGTAPNVDMGVFEFSPPFYVDADAAGAGNGTSWPNAYNNLDGALTHTMVTSGEVTEVWVAAGTYMPDGGFKPVGGGLDSGSGSRTATFQLRSGLGLYGGFDGTELCHDPRDVAANETILSGDLTDNDTLVACIDDSDCGSNGSRCYQGFGAAFDGFCIVGSGNSENSYHVVTGSGTDTATTIDGFTVVGGNANGVNPDDRGAGMLNSAGDATVKNCTFTGNTAFVGGGINNDGGSGSRVSDCTFRGNSVTGAGGGLRSDGANVVVSGCTFSSNYSDSTAAGIRLQFGRPSVINCVLAGNTVGASGAGMYLNATDATVSNCMLSGNTAANNGGGIAFDHGGGPNNSIVTNCTFASNRASVGGGIIVSTGANPTITNSIFWNNSDSGGMDESGQIHTFGGIPTVNDSIVQGGWSGAGGTGILDIDPLFVLDPDDGGDGWGVGGNDDFGDLHLQSLSPAVDAGDNDAIPADVADLDGDNDTLETLPFDLDGGARRLEDLLVADAGNAGSLGTPIVDLGAFEYLRDCNGNGIPDDQDLTNCAGNPDCEDCNANDIPDLCDIAECDPDIDLSCNDCDLNGVPDGCDDPVDNIPDDCVEAIATGNWSDAASWDLGGMPGDYPDNNTGIGDQNVTISGFAITLNLAVDIPTLLVTNGATLDASGFALTISGNTGALARDLGDPNETIFGPGTTTTVSELDATNILVYGNDPLKGSLLAKSDCDPPAVCVINAEVLTVNGGGIYQQAGTGSTMELFVNDVVLSGGACNSGGGGNGIIGGGEINLYDGMTLTTTADLRINGSATATCGAQRGILPPPKLTTGCSSARSPRTIPGLDIGGDFIVGGYASISISATSCGLGRALLPEQVLRLQGNFINRSPAPDFFDWESGGITLNGVTPQTFEVGGLDIGATAAGFNAPGVAGSNFSMGTVEVAPGASVTFVDNFNNDNKPQGKEALYVHDLVLGGGATVTIDNCKVYYGTLDDQGATINFLRSGVLADQSALVQAPLTAAFPHDRRKNRYLSFDPNKAEHDGKNVAFRVALASIAQGSCNDTTGGKVDFCRFDRGAADCNSCVGGLGGTCITTAIHCSTGGGVCTPTGATCLNDLPHSGGSNVGQTWWVGLEHPSANGVHLLVSQPFRKVSSDWPNPTHVGDCEVVPQAVYSVRAVGATADLLNENSSDELVVETTILPVGSPAAFWWADAIGALQFFCNGDITLPTCTVPTAAADCGAGIPCLRAWTLPNGSVNFDDVNAALTLVAPPGVGVPAERTWVDLHPVGGDAAPNSIINASDLQQFIFGFGGFPYSGFDPKDCDPAVVAWP